MGNLPAELTSFVGRGGEVAEVRRLLAVARLVTLTGVGGVGKSRLARRVAGQVGPAFPDGVWWVDLSGLRDHSLVPQAVCDALGIADRSTRDQVEVLAEFMANRRLLLVIDNCAHLVQSCAELVSRLLRAARRLRVLATSRETLQMPGERVYPVVPLLVPDPAGVADLATLGAAGTGVRYPGLALFGQRAAAAVPGFAFNGGNVGLAARVCRQLDGIPLAIELAAARLPTVSLAQLAAGLDDRFALLTGAGRGGPARHRTLRAAVEWSFELSTKPERLMWVRASVFAGRFDLEAAEQVCSGDGLAADEVFEAMAGLVDKSVISSEQQAASMRYRMLDTIRAYGLDRLRDPADADGLAAVDEAVLRRRHRDYYLELAEGFNTDWFGPRQAQWSRRMRAERENLRSALGFCLDTPGQERTGLRLAGALYYFWYGGEAREGRYWLERALAADPDPSRERVRALAAYGRVLLLQGSAAAVAEPARECLELAGRFDEPFYEIDALQVLGLSLVYRNDSATGLPLIEQAMVLAGTRGAAYPEQLAFAQLCLAIGRLFAGQPAQAAALAAESAAVCRAHGDRWFLGFVLGFAVTPALAIGEVAQAAAYARESLQAFRALEDPQGVQSALEFLAWIAVAEADHQRAARLLGAAARQWRDLGGSPFVGPWAQGHQEREAATRQALGDARYDTAYRAGGELGLDEAAAYALGEEGL